MSDNSPAITDYPAPVDRFLTLGKPGEGPSGHDCSSLGISQEHVLNVPGEPIKRGPKVGRNDPCPCGGGRKYKKCCGPA